MKFIGYVPLYLPLNTFEMVAMVLPRGGKLLEIGRANTGPIYRIY